MRLDSFQYFTSDHPPDHLAPILKRNRFDGSIAVNLDPAGAREFLELVGRHEFVRGALVRVDLDDTRLDIFLDECARWPKLRGVVWQAAGAIPWGLDVLQRRQLTVDVQMTPAQIPLAIEAARRYPELRMAILHLASPEVDGAPSEEWSNGMAVLARYPNVVCKASDLIHLSSGAWNGADLRPYVQHALAAFSPERVMFGSGWPSGLPDHIWKETLAAFTQAIGAQSMEVREELLGGAAARFYGI